MGAGPVKRTLRLVEWMTCNRYKISQTRNKTFSCWFVMHCSSWYRVQNWRLIWASLIRKPCSYIEISISLNSDYLVRMWSKFIFLWYIFNKCIYLLADWVIKWKQENPDFQQYSSVLTVSNSHFRLNKNKRRYHPTNQWKHTELENFSIFCLYSEWYWHNLVLSNGYEWKKNTIRTDWIENGSEILVNCCCWSNKTFLHVAYLL